jgi:ComF family protein
MMITETTEEALHTPAGLLLAIRQISQWGLDLLFPPQCGNCGRVDIGWCDTCTTLLSNVALSPQHITLADKITTISSGLHTDMLRNALHNLKYLNQRQLAPLLATRLADIFEHIPQKPDFITCVPMHPKKRAQRGYNQADLIAEPFARLVNIPYLPDALIRTRETISQVGLSGQQRHENMQDVFKVHSEQIRGKIGLIVDDVLTTGATLKECATALLAGEVSEVVCMTITRASDRS